MIFGLVNNVLMLWAADNQATAVTIGTKIRKVHNSFTTIHEDGIDCAAWIANTQGFHMIAVFRQLLNVTVNISGRSIFILSFADTLANSCNDAT